MSRFIKYNLKLFGEICRAIFTNDIDLDLSRILALGFYLLDNLAGEHGHFIITYHLRLNHNANLSARLNGVRLLNTLERGGNFLELLKSLYVILDILAPCARSCRRYRVSRLYDKREYGLGFNIAMVRLNCVNYRFALLVPPCKLNSEGYMRSLKLVVQRLAYVVEQAGALGKLDICTELGRYKSCNIRDLQGML